MSVAKDANAAITYVYAANRNASFAFGNAAVLATPLPSSQAVALLLASISTGRVIKLNSVVKANITIPASSNCGNMLIKRIPARSIHCTHFDEKLTTGTSADLICSHA